MDASQLAVRIKEKDPLVFAEITKVYYDRLFSTAYRMLGSRQESEDVLQETFIRLLTNIDKFDPSKNFTTWIFQITINLCIDTLRKRKTRRSVSLDAEPDYFMSQWPLKETLPSLDKGPEHVYLEQELSEELSEVMKGLSDKDRELVVKRYFYDMSLDEISQETQVPVGTIKSRLFRVRQLLKKKWSILNLRGASLNFLSSMMMGGPLF